MCLLSHISEMLRAISRINESIPGMFVLIFNVFVMVVPNMVMKFQNVDIVYKIYATHPRHIPWNHNPVSIQNYTKRKTQVLRSYFLAYR